MSKRKGKIERISDQMAVLDREEHALGFCTIKTAAHLKLLQAVGEAFPKETRRGDLPWAVYRLALCLPVEQREEFLAEQLEAHQRRDWNVEALLALQDEVAEMIGSRPWEDDDNGPETYFPRACQCKTKYPPHVLAQVKRDLDRRQAQRELAEAQHAELEGAIDDAISDGSVIESFDAEGESHLSLPKPARSKRRTPAERAMLEQLRADAWRWVDPSAIERAYLNCISAQEFTIYELNVIYEALAYLEFCDVGDDLEEKLRNDITQNDEIMKVLRAKGTDLDVAEMPLMMMRMSRMLQTEDIDAAKVAWVCDGWIDYWRKVTRNMRENWRWAHLTELDRMLSAFQDEGVGADRLDQIELQGAVGMAYQTILRIAWIFECEQDDELKFGPVTARRLPYDGYEAALTLRKFAEQQPELRTEPMFEFAAPKDASDWLNIRDYATLSMPPVYEEQINAILDDAEENRHHWHSHLAVIEVDRKPIKKIILAPEYVEGVAPRLVRTLQAIVVHDKGHFVCKVSIYIGPDAPIRYLLTSPFHDYAWNSLDADQQNPLGQLPPDAYIAAKIIQAWRDLIAPKIIDQHYEVEVKREGKKKGQENERDRRRGQGRVVHYLPRTVKIRREQQEERHEQGRHSLKRAYRVGSFARSLSEGQHRGIEAEGLRAEMNWPLRDDQTIVRAHIRGGTPEERDALLAQDDVRLWRSWSALDLF